MRVMLPNSSAKFLPPAFRRIEGLPDAGLHPGDIFLPDVNNVCPAVACEKPKGANVFFTQIGFGVFVDETAVNSK